MQQMTSTQLYARLLRYVKPYWGIFAFSILGMLITAATEVALPIAVIGTLGTVGVLLQPRDP